MKKKLLNILLGVAVTASFLAGCGGSLADENMEETTELTTEEIVSNAGETTTEEAMSKEEVIEQGGSVYYFNFKPEQDVAWKKLAAAYMAEGKVSVSWDFTTIPGEEWKNGFCSALTVYATEQTEDNWAAVVRAFVDGWAIEYSLAN